VQRHSDPPTRSSRAPRTVPRITPATTA
jgi:hypothetical protein